MRHLSRLSRHHGGFTLVELMIGMTLGLVLIGGVVGLFLQSSQSFRVDENVARMQDQARFAMDQLTRDLRMAGFVAEPLSAAAVTLDASLAIADGCGPGGEADWLVRVLDAGTDENNTLTGVDNATGAEAAAAYGCIDSSEVRRQTSSRSAGGWTHRAGGRARRGPVYLDDRRRGAAVQGTGCHPLAGPTDFREYRPQIYYIGTLVSWRRRHTDTLLQVSHRQPALIDRLHRAGHRRPADFVRHRPGRRRGRQPVPG
jgi:prepilin-type N-terminal cleavage/methylation domain-containing protein